MLLLMSHRSFLNTEILVCELVFCIGDDVVDACTKHV